MPEGQNECMMKPLDEIWPDEAAALIFNSLFLPNFSKVGLNGGLNIVKQNQTKNGFDIYMFQVDYLECDSI